MHRDSLISFIRFIQGFYVFQAKLRCIVSSAWLPGSPLWCAPLQLKSRLDPHLPFRASTWFPELEIRHQAHQEASGTHKWKGMAAANVTQQLRACLGSLQAPRGPSAQVSRALSNNKRSAIWDSLYLNYLEKKKKTYVKWALYMLFTHLASAPSEAEIDCLHCLLTLPTPLKAAAA